MKFNVHHWDGKNWNYLCTVRADSEGEAIDMVESRYGKARYQAYPHIDNFAEVA